MAHTRDDNGLILSRRNPKKRKEGVAWEGTYNISKSDEVPRYRAQFQFAGVTLNLGEYETAIEGAHVYTDFVDDVGDEMKDAIASGADFSTTVRTYLGKDPALLGRIDKLEKDYAKLTKDRNDLTELDALRQAMENLEGALPPVKDLGAIKTALSKAKAKNNLERSHAALEVMKNYYQSQEEMSRLKKLSGISQ